MVASRPALAAPAVNANGRGAQLLALMGPLRTFAVVFLLIFRQNVSVKNVLSPEAILFIVYTGIFQR